MLSPDIKVKVQNFGRFLSNMVMPNIGAFIAWGLITALFIPTGWLPNETLAKLVGPMITYLLPLLIGYTGGRLIGGERGGGIAARSGEGEREVGGAEHGHRAERHGAQADIGPGRGAGGIRRVDSQLLPSAVQHFLREQAKLSGGAPALTLQAGQRKA